MKRTLTFLTLAAAAVLVAVPLGGAAPAGPGANAPVVAVSPSNELTNNEPEVATTSAGTFVQGLHDVTFVENGAHLLRNADVDAGFLLRHADDLTAGDTVASDWAFEGTHGNVVVIEETRVRFVTLDALADATADAITTRTGTSVSAVDVAGVELSAHADNEDLVSVVESAAATAGPFAPVTTEITRAAAQHALDTREPLVMDRDVAAFLGDEGILLVERAWFVLDRDEFRGNVENALFGAQAAQESAEEQALENVLDGRTRVHDALAD